MIIRNKTVFVYDLEVFPNLFTCTVKNSESKRTKSYEISCRKNELVDIIKLFLNPKILFCGFNNKHYDDLLINYLILDYESVKTMEYRTLCKALKELSDRVIIAQDTKQFSSVSKYKYAGLFASMDLLTMMFSNKLRVGLKELEVTMGFPIVHEYEGDFNKDVPKQDIEKVIAYKLCAYINIHQCRKLGELLES